MIKRELMLLLILSALVTFSGIANADLVTIGMAAYDGRDYKLIYEDDKDLIWLDYTNKGGQDWDNQMKWVTGLNNQGVLIYKFNKGISVSWQGDWRLPRSIDGARRFGYDGSITAGFNIRTSEMGHLYYESLGNRGYYDTKGNPHEGFEGLKNTGPFVNLEPDIYWSGEYGPDTKHAWDFNMYWGAQSNYWKIFTGFYGLAVRPGKVVGR